MKIILIHIAFFLLLTSCVKKQSPFFTDSSIYAGKHGLYYYLTFTDSTFSLQYGRGLGSFLCEGKWELKSDSIILSTDEEYISKLLDVKEKVSENDTLKVMALANFASGMDFFPAHTTVFSSDTIISPLCVPYYSSIKVPIDSMQIYIYMSKVKNYTYIPKNKNSNHFEFIVTSKNTCISSHETLNLRVKKKRKLVLTIQDEDVVLKRELIKD